MSKTFVDKNTMWHVSYNRTITGWHVIELYDEAGNLVVRERCDDKADADACWKRFKQMAERGMG